MMQETEAGPSTPRRKHQGALPGIRMTVAIAIISGIVCWSWLASGWANPPKAAALTVSGLTEVAATDIAGALTTISQSDGVLAQFRKGKDDSCRRPLAWVSLVSAPGEPPSRVRLISGRYYSPLFGVSATPVRVAIPFPAPYETGRGTLTAIDVGGSATISLLPAWRVSPQDGKTTHAVIWRPGKNCPSNG